MFSLKFSIFLLIVLFIPFYLRTLQQIEPYPAVLMPSGPSVIKNVNNQVNLKVKKLYAIDNTGKWKKINLRLLLYPIPPQYSETLASKGFGFGNDSSEGDRTKNEFFKKIKDINTASPSKEELADLRQWLKMKLAQQNFATSAIKLVTILQSISIETEVVLEQKVIYEKIITLD